jgi:hypothetical protein
MVCTAYLDVNVGFASACSKAKILALKCGTSTQPACLLLVDCSSHIDKTRRVDWVNEPSTKIRQAGWVDLPHLSANIFAAGTSKTNIHNKTGSTHHLSVNTNMI